MQLNLPTHSEEKTSSTPSISEFDPTIIPYQYQVLEDIRENFDYKLGTHEILLSGSVGSAKSLLMAHIAITHVLLNPGSRFALCRKALPDLKATIFKKVLEHMDADLIEGEDYRKREHDGYIRLSNGSEIVSKYWADKRYMRLRSLELSGACIEELTENNEDDMQAYNELKMRIGRLPHVKEKILICASNPGSPRHWAYKYFITSQSPTRHVYYSRTEDNPFLPRSYIEQLKADLDPKLARRMIYGEWIELNEEGIYYQYNSDLHFKRETTGDINPHYDLHIAFDFNIGYGKPMSAVIGQFINDHFYFYDEVVIEGANTEDVLDEFANRGYFETTQMIRIHGDAAGKHRDTRNKRSDYDIITQYLGRYRTQKGNALRFQLDVPAANPSIRERHNLVNAYLKNATGQIRFTAYAKCKVLDEGMRLTSLKKGADYIEDDSKAYQHITTACGYMIYFLHLVKVRRKTGQIQL